MQRGLVWNKIKYSKNSIFMQHSLSSDCAFKLFIVTSLDTVPVLSHLDNFFKLNMKCMFFSEWQYICCLLCHRSSFLCTKAHLFDKQNPTKTIPKCQVFLNSTLLLIITPLHQAIPLGENIQNISLLVNPSGRKNRTSACSLFFHKGKQEFQSL